MSRYLYHLRAFVKASYSSPPFIGILLSVISFYTRITIDVMQKDLSRDDMLQVLEGFMKSMGYTFSPKECLTIDIHP